jgi:hypothetical protein
MATAKTLTIDGVEYVKKSEASGSEYKGDKKIVILQRGWVMAGRLERDGSECKLHNAHVIRVWGTTNGLGELAESGKLSQTKLDKCYGVVEFDWLTVVAAISVNPEKWPEL